jgi:hypothetical protein
MRTYGCLASQPKLSCLQVSGWSGHLTIPHVSQLAARLFRGKILGIFVGQTPLRTSGRQTFRYRIMEAMRRSTARQLDGRLLRAVSAHRCEITGVKFWAGLLSD